MVELDDDFRISGGGLILLWWGKTIRINQLANYQERTEMYHFLNTRRISDELSLDYT